MLVFQDLHLRNLTSPLLNQWLEDEFPFGKSHFQVRTVCFRESVNEIGIFPK